MHFFSQEGPHNGPLGGLWAQFSALWVPFGARPTMSIVAIIVVIIVVIIVARARYYCRHYCHEGPRLLSSLFVVGPNLIVEPFGRRAKHFCRSDFSANWRFRLRLQLSLDGTF